MLGYYTVYTMKQFVSLNAQIEVGSVSLHRFSVFPVIKSVMSQRKSGTQNECSYGRYERFPFLMTERLDFGQSIEGMGLPPSERSASAPLVLLYQQEGLFPRTLLDDNGLRLPSLLE